MINTRARATQLIHTVFKQQKNLNTIDTGAEAYSASDKAFMHALVFG